jgi:hypothetical protein
VELLPDRAQRRVQLGREDQDREAGVQTEVARHELQPDGRRDERRAEHRDELEHERAEKRDPQRRHRRAAVAIGDLRDHADLCAGADMRAQRRQAADDVGEVRAEQGEGAPA